MAKKATITKMSAKEKAGTSESQGLEPVPIDFNENIVLAPLKAGEVISLRTGEPLAASPSDFEQAMEELAPAILSPIVETETEAAVDDATDPDPDGEDGDFDGNFDSDWEDDDDEEFADLNPNDPDDTDLDDPTELLTDDYTINQPYNSSPANAPASPALLDSIDPSEADPAQPPPVNPYLVHRAGHLSSLIDAASNDSRSIREQITLLAPDDEYLTILAKLRESLASKQAEIKLMLAAKKQALAEGRE